MYGLSECKKIEFRKQGLGRIPNKAVDIGKDEEEKMFDSGAFGITTPKGLITALYYNFGKLFGFRARDEARQLKFGDIVVKESAGGKYLEFQERCTKTRDGSNVKNVRDTTAKIFSSDMTDNRDPIKLYQQYLHRTPVSMRTPDSPFFLTPIPEQRLTGSDNEPWYYPRPMGENTLGTLIKTAASAAGIEKKITNHSIRKTTVTSLSRAGVPPQKIMKITGHKNIQSITHYDAELTETEHRNMQNIMQNCPKKQTPEPLKDNTSVVNRQHAETPISNISQSSPNQATGPITPVSFLPGCSFNNCTFNI